MESQIFSFIANANNTTSVVLIMLGLVVFGWLVPKWRYDELKDELNEYKQTTTSLIDQLKEVSRRLDAQEARNANDVSH